MQDNSGWPWHADVRYPICQQVQALERPAKIIAGLGGQCSPHEGAVQGATLSPTELRRYSAQTQGNSGLANPLCTDAEPVWAPHENEAAVVTEHCQECAGAHHDNHRIPWRVIVLSYCFVRVSLPPFCGRHVTWSRNVMTL